MGVTGRSPTNYHEVGDLPVTPMYGGTFLHGMFMEGASWEEGSYCLCKIR